MLGQGREPRLQLRGRQTQQIDDVEARLELAELRPRRVLVHVVRGLGIADDEHVPDVRLQFGGERERTCKFQLGADTGGVRKPRR